MTIRMARTGGGVLLALAAISSVAQAQPSLTAFAGVVAGQGTGSIANNCTTFQDPTQLALFRPITSLQTANPSLAACGYGGGYSLVTGTTGPTVNGRSLTNQAMNTSGGLFSGAANATASYGSLGASASGTNTAGITSTSLQNSAGAATFSDFLTATSPLGSSLVTGFVQYQFAVDGSLSALNSGSVAFTQLILSQNDATPSEIMRATVFGGGAPVISASSTLPLGWTGSTGSLSGGSTFLSLLIPITWGTQWKLTVGLLANTGSTATSQFLSTAKITGVNFFDNNRNALSGVTLRSQSGTDYFNVGVTPPTTVPEPSTTGLMLMGLTFVAAIARRKRRL